MADNQDQDWDSVAEAFHEAYGYLAKGTPEEAEFVDRFLDAWAFLDAERAEGEGFLEVSKRLGLPGGGALSYASDGGWNMLVIAVDYPDSMHDALAGLEKIAEDIRNESADRAVALDIYRFVLGVVSREGDRRERAWSELCGLFGWDEMADGEPSLQRLRNRLDRMRQLEASFQSATNVALRSSGSAD